jgi:hypothetical protein
MAYVEQKRAELESEKIILQEKIIEQAEREADAKKKRKAFTERMVRINIFWRK